MAASISSSGVTPRKAIRRYVEAKPLTSSPAPKAATEGSVSTTPAAEASTPMSTASHSPSTPCASAPRRSPAPRCRATLLVVP